MNAIATSTTEQPVIVLDFEEGQQVILLAGATVNGLTTRCNQPGKVIHVQYSQEFGVTYVVSFGKLGMYAYVSADDLQAVAPLLDLYPEVDPGDMLPALLDDAIEFIEAGDTVLWDFAACAEPQEGVVVKTRPNLEYALVKFEHGALRWLHIDEIQLVLKAAALETQSPAFAGA